MKNEIICEKYSKNPIYEIFYNQSNIPFFVLDLDLRIIDINSGIKKLLHITKKEILNKYINDFFALFAYVLPDDILNKIKFNSNIDFITSLKIAENLKTIKWITYLLEDQKKIIVIGNNISKFVNETLNHNMTSSYLNHIVNNLPHFIFWKDQDSIFRGCNEKFAKAAGFSSVFDIIGKSDYDMPWSQEQAKDYIDDDLDIIKFKKSKLNYEERQRQLNGEERVMLVSKVPMYDSETSSIVGIVGIYTDITERKRMEEELRQAKERAEHAVIIKNEFIRNMEHDIRTPFNGIWMMSEHLHSLEEDAMKKDLLADIMNSSKELMSFCNEILDFARTQDDSLPVIANQFKPKDLFENIIHIQKPAIISKNLEFITYYDAALPEVLVGDSYRLLRILINLVSNATKFTDKGFIKIHFEMEECIENKIILKIIVEDSGLGIPRDKQEYIFESFTKLSQSNKNKYKGIGLGLQIVKKFVADMNGELYLESTPKKGTRFICRFPMFLCN